MVDDSPMMDGPPAPHLACGDFTPAFASAPPQRHIEPGIHVDGLRVVARVDGGGFQREAVRASQDGLFAEFNPPVSFPETLEDPTFVVINSEVVAFGVLAPGRRIVVCPSPSASASCTVVSLVDSATSSAITDDVDGPAAGVLAGEPVLAFNRGSDLYLARTSVPGDLTAWEATRIDVPLPAANLDDPALTADGEVLLFLRRDIGSRIYMMRWQTALARYGELMELDAGVGAGGAPALHDRGDTVELLFELNTRGTPEPHRALCTRAP